MNPAAAPVQDKVQGRVLTVSGLTAGYGDATILEDVSLEIGGGTGGALGGAPGGGLALLGRNGAGKSTLVATLLGLTRVHAGSIRLDGREVRHWRPHHRARAGLAWVPQEREVFPSLTVAENLSVVARPGPWNPARAYQLFPSLAQRRGVLAGRLSGGEQQMLAIGRALMLNPWLLLLDEPFEGLAPLVVEEMARAIARMLGEGIAVLLVEQHVQAALKLCGRAVVLERGRVRYAGASADLAADPALIESLMAMPEEEQRQL